ncbi:bacterio-opsin activator domain-containing protein [Halobaculum magnesiiphilum]|uniref:GAF domain-containing protein n=1 Tax=Halobaculum magnesiiphilum TaxID=1017351 RepID=A0A8T8WFZ3_9EURY|nr:bacterio-opsin activator domain-containing protein [Halobaculum magnesiiphilum]QZP38751.1 GAF domain-containing protein [Halobaculum magnesiiphilum]
MGPQPLSEVQRETLASFPGRGHPLTASEVANRTGVGRRAAYDRLRRLAEAGHLETKKVGSGGRVWWRPPASERGASDADRAAERSGDLEGVEADHGETRHQYRTLVEQFPNGVLALVDRDMRYTTFGGTLEGETDVAADALVGEPLREALPDEVADAVIPGYERALDGEASEYEAAIDDHVYRFHFYPVRDDDGEVFEALGMSQAVTERVEYQRELEKRVRQQEAVATLGRRALEADDLDDLFATAARVVAETLGNDYCEVLDLDADSGELRLRQGVGWDDGVVGSATVSALEDGSRAAYTLCTSEPVVVEDLREERRFDPPELLTSHGVRSGISTVIGPPESPWGILGTHDTEPATRSDHDAAFVRAVANVLASAIDRTRHERELDRQHDQLVALDSVSRVVRDITEAAIDRSTRAEIEAAVCERLAASESYLFAWIGDADAASREITTRAEAGVERYLDGTTVSIDPDDEHGRGPTGRAYRTRTIQTTDHAAADPRQEPWADQVEAYGYRSSAAIPIVHGGTVYGVLNVYTERREAFLGREREVIGKLGEVVGHAIAAVERKRALLGDEVVELSFLVEDAFAPAGVDPAPDPIRFDDAVPLGDDEFVVFGRTTAAGVETLESLVDSHSLYQDLRVRSADDGRRFELSVADLPVLSAIASQGGSIEDAVVEDGDYRLTVRLAPSTDARRVIDAMRETYPDVRLVKRRQVTRAGTDRSTTAVAAIDSLSDRQRAALSAAYHAGYFEWPRDATAEEVASSLDIARSTLHRHLRTCQRTVFAAAFEGG